MQKFANQFIRQHGIYDSFYIANMRVLDNKIKQWQQHLPRVKPFYAVKCNPNQEMIKHMIANDFGFDCASKHEIDTILQLGGKPSDIIYAHPIKRVDDLLYASKNNIRYTTFDSLSELQKIHSVTPKMKCVLRVKVDNPTARVQLGLKYGATKDEYKSLIDNASRLGVDIVGTSFHVGSASSEPMVFKDGIEFAKLVFDYAKQKGFMNCNLLDVGGGFTKETFISCSEVINTELDKHFNDPNVRVIAEPGRYFAEEVFTFFVPVIGYRQRDNINQYWIADSLYGSFNCILYDGQVPTYKVIRNPQLGEYEGVDTESDSVLHLATCDSLDTLKDPVKLPLLRLGDYLMIENFGAYTLAGACDFNGINMTNPHIVYVGL